MNKTAKIFLSIFIVGAFAVAVGFIFSLNSRLTRYKRAYELGYRRAFTELVGSVNSIDSDLSKGVYAQSPSMLVTLATDIYRHAEAAKSALSVLPTSDVSLERTSNFISQVGDFSVSLARSAARGDTISDEARQNLQAMNDTAAQLSAELTELYSGSEANGFFDVSSSEALSSEEYRGVSFVSGMASLESSLPDSPVLIYDGPYSSHITQTVPQYLQAGGEPINAGDARSIAARFLGISADTLSLTAKAADPVVYTFSDESGDVISVTAVGGHVVSYSQNVVPGAAVYDGAQAAETAKSFLMARGYRNMAVSYYYAMNGVCYINFEYEEQGVLIYPDLVQVGIAMDTGRITYFQANGYLNNHREGRDLTAALSEADARGKLSASFSVEGAGKLCIIPSLGKNEILCYEFKAIGVNEKKYLCYINANSGVEENIFILIEDENGVLTV